MSLIHKIKNYKCILPILIMFGVGLFNSIYFIFLRVFCNKKRAYQCDLLNFRVFEWGKTCCSAWPISHFILFFILGLFFPDCWLPVLTLGVTWEIVEFTLGTFQKQKGVKIGKYQYTGKWWQANIYDIFFNTAGFFLGFGINKLWRKKNTPNPVYDKPDNSIKDLKRKEREKEEREKKKNDRAAVAAMASWFK